MGPPTQPHQQSNQGNNQLNAVVTGQQSELLTPDSSVLLEQSHFNQIRDSLVFNHERLILNHNQDYEEDEIRGAPAHYPSLQTLHQLQGPEENFITAPAQRVSAMVDETNDEAARNFPRLFSVSGSVTDRRNLNRANANDIDSNKHVGWRDRSISSDIELQNALAQARGIAQKDPSDIPLARQTDASLNLPTPPESPLSKSATKGGDGPKGADGVTTVFAYKMDRRKLGEEDHNCESGVNQSGVLDLINGADPQKMLGRRSSFDQIYSASKPAYEEEENPQPAFSPIPRYVAEGGDMMLLQNQNQNEVISGEYEVADLDPFVAGRDVEAKRNDTDLTNVNTTYTVVDMDDEIEEDFAFCCSKPVFPNPADLKWPEPFQLKMSLPKKYHTFLATNFKKDCRAWLWKNGIGPRARELLEGRTSSSTSVGVSSFPREPPPRATMTPTPNKPLPMAMGITPTLQPKYKAPSVLKTIRSLSNDDEEDEDDRSATADQKQLKKSAQSNEFQFT